MNQSLDRFNNFLTEINQSPLNLIGELIKISFPFFATRDAYYSTNIIMKGFPYGIIWKQSKYHLSV